MTRSLNAALLLVGILLVTAGCGEPAATTPPLDVGEPVELRYTCGILPFEASLLTAERRNDEDADGPIAEALRRYLGPGGDPFLPKGGWTFVGENGSEAEFVTQGGELGMKRITLSNEGGWAVTGYGDCRPHVVLPDGLGPATWSWGGPGEPGPETTDFDALVTERACASGQPPGDRLLPPTIVASDEEVIVLFSVRVTGGTCPSNPSTRVVVDLSEPLGERALLDGAELPWRDPRQPDR